MLKNIEGLCSYMQMPLILGEVLIIGEAYDKLSSINFDDHDLEAFPKLAPKFYLKRVLEDDVLRVLPMPWACGLEGSGLLNLLHIPHFGLYNVTDQVVRQLLALIHDGSLWIQDCIPINATLIHRITGLPMEGLNPMEHVGKK